MSGNPYAKQSQMWPLAEAVRAYVVPIDRTAGRACRSIRRHRGSSIWIAAGAVS